MKEYGKIVTLKKIRVCHRKIKLYEFTNSPCVGKFMHPVQENVYKWKRFPLKIHLHEKFIVHLLY